MNEETDKKLRELLAVRRDEAFWERQRSGILAAAHAAPSPLRPWLLAPAAALAAVLVMLLAKPQPPSTSPDGAVSVAFLENIDLLDDMDVLEAVAEEEL